MRRVVITGLGLVTPLGCGVDATWTRLLEGRSGARRVDGIPGRRPALPDRGFRSARRRQRRHVQSRHWMEPKEQRKVDDFIIYAMSAADQALKDAGWAPKTDDDQERTGVLIGSGIGGLSGIADTSILLKEKGPRRVSPFFIPGRLINLASGYVSIKHKLKGPNHAVVTACSTGAHAIGDASRLIALGDADVMVAGGAESPICRIALAGFAACKALSTGFNDAPTKASRPYDRDRDGFVMGEGAGVVVLEEYEHAKARGARIYAEVVGYGLSGDAYHITAPAEIGDGAFRCMKAAVKRAGISTERHRLRQRARHLDADGRRDRARAPSSGCSGNAATSCRCRRPNRRSATCSARPARSRRSSRCWPSATTSRRRRSTSTTRRSKPRSTWCRTRRDAEHDRHRAVQLVRLRRHQCIADRATGRLTAWRHNSCPALRQGDLGIRIRRRRWRTSRALERTQA